MSALARLATIATLMGVTMSAAAQDPKSAEVRELVELLTAIEAVVPSTVSRTFSPGAPDDALEQLSRTVLKGQALPMDLAALLKWHNGQEWNSKLSPNNNRRLLTVAEIIDEWSFFNDPSTDFLKPRSASWVPVLTNDAGDSLVYETRGPSAGSLIAYWHDDERRPVEYASLKDWATHLLSEWRQQGR